MMSDESHIIKPVIRDYGRSICGVRVKEGAGLYHILTIIRVQAPAGKLLNTRIFQSGTHNNPAVFMSV